MRSGELFVGEESPGSDRISDPSQAVSHSVPCMDFDWAAILAFGATSGIAAGLVNQLLTWWRESRQRNHAASEVRALQEDERAHEAILRAEAAHGDAAGKFIGYAADATDWIEYKWGQDFGEDVDYVGVNRKAPELESPADVIDALRQIERRHPTKGVRMQAERLASSIDSEFNMINGDTVGEPDAETYRSWKQQGDQLIAQILEPPPRVA